MNNRPRARGDDALTRLVTGMRDQLRLQLLEAQRRLVNAPDEPFSEEEIQTLMTASMLRSSTITLLCEGGGVRDVEHESEMMASHDEIVAVRHELSSVVGWHARPATELMSTHVDSFSVDMRGLESLPAFGERRSSPCDVEPVVWNVWAGYDDFAVWQIPAMHAATVRYDARLCAGEWEMFESAVCGPAECDLVGCGDEVGRQVLRG